MNTPTIYLVDQSKRHPGYAKALLQPLRDFVDMHFAPVWGTPCVLAVAKTPVAKAWNLIFIDNTDEADALGYHEYYKGMPLGKVFVQTTLDAGEDVCVTTSHELAEMLVDPTANLTAKGPKGLLYAYETGDPVEESFFTVRGQKMTNFVTPQWFENFKHAAGTKYDFLGHLKKPFTLERGGYAAVQRDGEWTQIFGSSAKQARWEREDRRGHRNEDLRK